MNIKNIFISSKERNKNFRRFSIGAVAALSMSAPLALVIACQDENRVTTFDASELEPDQYGNPAGTTFWTGTKTKFTAIETALNALRIDIPNSTDKDLRWINIPQVPAEYANTVDHIEYLFGNFGTQALAMASTGWRTSLGSFNALTLGRITYKVWARLVPKGERTVLSQTYFDLTAPYLTNTPVKYTVGTTQYDVLNLLPAAPKPATERLATDLQQTQITALLQNIKVALVDGQTLAGGVVWSEVPAIPTSLFSEVQNITYALGDYGDSETSDEFQYALNPDYGVTINWFASIPTSIPVYAATGVRPATPGVPAITEIIGGPAKPAVPGTPEVPSQNGNPAQPAVPAQEAKPATYYRAARPGIPGSPELPARPRRVASLVARISFMPGIVAAFAQEAVPAVPATPTTPAVPAKDAVPAKTAVYVFLNAKLAGFINN